MGGFKQKSYFHDKLEKIFILLFKVDESQAEKNSEIYKLTYVDSVNLS